MTGGIYFCADPLVRPAYPTTDIVSPALRLFQDVDLVPTVSREGSSRGCRILISHQSRRGAHCAPANQRAYTRYPCCTRRGRCPHRPVSTGHIHTAWDAPVGRDDPGAPSAGSTNTLHPSGLRAHNVRPYKPLSGIAATKKNFPPVAPHPATFPLISDEFEGRLTSEAWALKQVEPRPGTGQHTGLNKRSCKSYLDNQK